MITRKQQRAWRKRVRELIEAQRDLNGDVHDILRVAPLETSLWVALCQSTYETVDHLLVLQQAIEELEIP